MGKITVGKTTLREAKQLITEADAHAEATAVEQNKWCPKEQAWIIQDDPDCIGFLVSGARPKGSGKDYRRAIEIVRQGVV